MPMPLEESQSLQGGEGERGGGRGERRRGGEREGEAGEGEGKEKEERGKDEQDVKEEFKSKRKKLVTGLLRDKISKGLQCNFQLINDKCKIISNVEGQL